MTILLMLVPVGGVDVQGLMDLAPTIEERFPIDVKVLVPLWREQIPLAYYNAERMQYNAVLVNAHLASRFSEIVEPPKRLLVGIVEGDGYIEGLNFVFGLATPELGVATVYTARIKGAKYPERLRKLILHETGHLLGLKHCPDQKCVMKFSNSLQELDMKGDKFCPNCTQKLIKKYK